METLKTIMSSNYGIYIVVILSIVFIATMFYFVDKKDFSFDIKGIKVKKNKGKKEKLEEQKIKEELARQEEILRLEENAKLEAEIEAVKASTRTREMIKHQMRYAKEEIDRFLKTYIEEDDDVNLMKYLGEKTCNEVYNWIVINNMKDSESYINEKQLTIANIVEGVTKDKICKTDKFQKELSDEVRKVIVHLVKMKEEE